MTLTWPKAPLTKDELLVHIETGWRTFRAATERIGELGWGRKTPYGWYLKDVLAHVAAWEAEMPKRLADYRGDPDAYRSPTTAEIDEFNADAVARARPVPLDGLFRQLEESHRRLVDAARHLSPDELSSQRVIDLLASRTFGHYQEHANDFGLRSFVE